MENVPFEGVFPIENGDIPSSYVILPEGSSPFVGFASLKKPEASWEAACQRILCFCGGMECRWIGETGRRKKMSQRKTGVKRRHGEKSVDFPNF